MFFLRCDFDAMIGKTLMIATRRHSTACSSLMLFQQHLAFSQLRWSFEDPYRFNFPLK
jgi:hypothetical protein